MDHAMEGATVSCGKLGNDPRTARRSKALSVSALVPAQPAAVDEGATGSPERRWRGYCASVIETGWRVRCFEAELAQPGVPLPFVAELPGEWEGWVAEQGVPVGTPFLISPMLEYDVELNAFFRSELVYRSRHTQLGYARVLTRFRE